MHKIVLLGPPGSGKGTQAEILAKALNIPTISTGEIFRNEMTNKTDLGLAIDEVMRAGKLVDDKIVNQVVKNRLTQDDVKNGYILDGYPRKISQAIFLSEVDSITHVINLEIRDTITMKRLADRRHCAKCGQTFHLQFKKPLVENKCDKCGGELVIRPDSSKEVIGERLAIYHFNIDPILEYYGTRGLLLNVDGEPDIQGVSDNIKKVLSL